MFLVCLEKAQSFSSCVCVDERLQRISRAAEPFLNFSPRLALATKFVGTLVSEGSALDKVGRVAFLVTNVVLSSYFSAQISIASATYSLAESLYQIWQGEAKRGDFFEAFKSFVQVGALSIGGPYLFAMSYAVHAVSYGLDAYRDAKVGYCIESLAHALLSGIYAYQMKPHLQQVYLNYGKRRLTEDEIDAILENMGHIGNKPKNDKYGVHRKEDLSLDIVDSGLKKFSEEDLHRIPFDERSFEAFLKNNGFSRHIQRIDFSKAGYFPKNVENIIFDSCKFPNMDELTIRKTIFIGSCLKEARIENCTFEDCTFQECSFEKSYFKDCKILESSFGYCFFDQFNALNSAITSSDFSKCSMKRAQLFFAKIYETSARACDFSHTVLSPNADIKMIESKQRDKSRPIVALGAYLHRRAREEYGIKIEETLLEKGADILLYDKIPMGLSAEDEVAKCLSGYTPDSGLSRAQTVLLKRDPNSQIAKIQLIAKAIISQSQGLLIPGGGDVSEIFYKDSPHDDLTTYALMEFALLSEAIESKKPVLGICRGLQLINVFLGGTLKQTANGHGIQKIAYVGKKVNSVVQRMFSSAIKKRFFYGHSCHNQAINKLGAGLEILLEYKDVIKGISTQNGRVIGLQFHPEQAKDLYAIFDMRRSRRLLTTWADYRKWTRIVEESLGYRRVALLEEFRETVLGSRYNPFANLRIYSTFIEFCKKEESRNQRLKKRIWHTKKTVSL